MCIIMHKPANVAFPDEAILKNCWDNNPDMGGFMYAYNNKVYIKKGYKTWETFNKALKNVRKVIGDKVPYVCHFRISTQGYDTSCCQPFPLSENMNRLKKQKTDCNIGIAHNGILDITSDGARDYSDTMKFITDYLANIIRSYDWFKDKRTNKLIENLIDGSRLAILDKNGHCEHMGKGWVEDYGCFFSNSTYSYSKVKWNYVPSGSSLYVGVYRHDRSYFQNKRENEEATKSKTNKSVNKKYYWWSDYWNNSTSMYDFEENYCPYTEEDDDCYCGYCASLGQCKYTKACGLLSKKA